jgi:hypothetical protein
MASLFARMRGGDSTKVPTPVTQSGIAKLVPSILIIMGLFLSMVWGAVLVFLAVRLLEFA